MTDSNTDNAAVSIWPTVWKFSLILAGCTFAFALVRYFTGTAGSTGMGLLGLVITIVVLVIALRKYRSLNGGYMSFGAATLAAFMINFLSSVIASTLNAVYVGFIDKTILTTLSDQTLTQLQQTPGMSKQMLDMMSGFYKNFLFTPGGMFVIGCVGGLIGGIILALILAAILKKTPPISG